MSEYSFGEHTGVPPLPRDQGRVLDYFLEHHAEISAGRFKASTTKPFMPKEKEKVLFVCTHNSNRSQMAEGLLRRHYGDYYDVYSAGTVKTAVNPRAVEAMREVGIDISGHQSKTVEAFGDITFDYVVTVCDNARENCPYIPARKKNFHRSFQDPGTVEGPNEEKQEAFRRVRGEIEKWIKQTFERRNM